MNLVNAWELVSVIETIERGNQAIDEYIKLGISGTIHDLEHQEMREAALRRFTELTNVDGK